jgi:hypothetical protein
MYDVSNCLFDSISYLLKCSLTSFQIKQNNMQYLKQCLTCHLRELNSSFLYDLHHGEVSNEYQYIGKMSQSGTISEF